MYYPEHYSMQNSLYGVDLQKKMQFSGCQSALSYDLRAWKPGKNPLRFRRRCVDMEKNGSSCLMLMEKRESRQLSKKLSMQICSSDSVARAANVVRWDESDPLPTGPPEKCLSTKKISFYTEMSDYHREPSALCITKNICLPLGDSSLEPQQLLVESTTFLGLASCKWCKMQSEYHVKGTGE